MIIPVIALLIGLATVFTVLAFVHRDYMRALFSTLIATVIWFALAGGSAQVGIPYALENTADNSVMTGTYQVEGPESWLAWIFLYIGLMMIVYLFVIVTEGILKANRVKQ